MTVTTYHGPAGELRLVADPDHRRIVERQRDLLAMLPALVASSDPRARFLLDSWTATTKGETR